MTYDNILWRSKFGPDKNNFPENQARHVLQWSSAASWFILNGHSKSYDHPVSGLVQLIKFFHII